MKVGLDEYSRNARLKPAFIVVLPLALTIAVLGFKQSAAEGVLLGIASSLGFTFLLAQLVRDRGKAKEPKLFQLWGGKPTTAMLRHGEPRINLQTRTRYHKKLGSLLSLPLPSDAQQRVDPAGADAKYETCVDYLLSRTRDTQRFQLLFQENVNYGFRRNLWAMKPVGLVISVASLATLSAVNLFEAAVGDVRWFTNLTAITIIALLLTWWLLRINPNWVRLSADEYARRLLSCIDDLQP
jgi:hypothetical protein